MRICRDLQSILDSEDERAIEVANEVDAMLVEFGELLLDEVELVETIERLVRSLETSEAVIRVDAADATPDVNWTINLRSPQSGQVLGSTSDTESLAELG